MFRHLVGVVVPSTPTGPFGIGGSLLSARARGHLEIWLRELLKLGDWALWVIGVLPWCGAEAKSKVGATFVIKFGAHKAIFGRVKLQHFRDASGQVYRL